MKKSHILIAILVCFISTGAVAKIVKDGITYPYYNYVIFVNGNRMYTGGACEGTFCEDYVLECDNGDRFYTTYNVGNDGNSHVIYKKPAPGQAMYKYCDIVNR